MNIRMRFAGFALGVLLAACERAPAPTPPLELPVLERPTVAVQAPAGRANVYVPRAVLVERAGIPGVYVLDEGRARFRMVRTGVESAGRVQLIAGLQGGEVLVAGDLGPVHDGSPIRTVQSPGQPR